MRLGLQIRVEVLGHEIADLVGGKGAVHLDDPDAVCAGGSDRVLGHETVAGDPVALLADLPTRWAGRRVMLIGHVATQRALEQVINGVSVQELTAAAFEWRAEGWEYRLG